MFKQIGSTLFWVLCLTSLFNSAFVLAVAPVQQSDGLTLTALQNAEYQTEFVASGLVTLTNGEYREKYDDTSATELVVALSDKIAFGDLNSDGVEDAAVILITDPGGSGSFYDLAAVINEAGQPKNVAIRFLGDRIELKSLTIEDGQIAVDMVRHGPNDPMCCPSDEHMQTYLLDSDRLTVAGPLIPYSNGELYGYVDLSGAWAIEPRFDFADTFSEALALVNVGEQYGYIDRTGAFVIEPQFAFATPFAEGLAAASMDHKAGFIDQTGQFVIEAQFDFANNFSEGLAAVGIEGRTGFIDREGNLVIEPQFNFGSNFSEGLAAVSVNDSFGYIDTVGQIVIEPVFDFADNFSEGLAVVIIDDQTGYIDQTGQIIIAPELAFGFPFAEGLAYVDTGETTGYIDQMGQLVIEGPYDFGFAFSEGLAAVQVDNRVGFIDREGQIVIEPQFQSAGSFEDGLAYVQLGNTWGYLDRSGQLLFELPIATLAGDGFRPTELINYLPTVPDDRRSGSCFTPSLIVSLDSAWRCTVANQIFDPCLVANDGESLVCGMNPPTGEAGFRLVLTEPLPEPDIATGDISETIGERLSRETLANASYESDWSDNSNIRLSDGVYKEEYKSESASALLITLSDIMAYGDLNGDGLEDAAVILVTNAGGSGTFYDLAAVLNQDGQPDHVASILLGDRIVIDGLTIEDGQIHLNMITHRATDGMCCPSLPAIFKFVLEDENTLTLGHTNAWLLQLANGSRCGFLTGATLTFEDRRLNYGCDDDSHLLGDLVPGVIWTAEQVEIDSKGATAVISSSQVVDVGTVWKPVDPAAITAEIGLDLDDVSLTLGDIGQTMTGHIRPMTSYNPNVAPTLNGEPAHLRFAFDKLLPLWSSGVNPTIPQLIIYPVEAYRAMYRTAGVIEIDNRIDGLASLLADRPAAIGEEIPVLPEIGADQMMRSQIEYLDFEGGSGIRFITHYAQDIGPILNGNIFYTFQGLTDDGRYYLSFFYPITTIMLPDAYEDTAAAEDYAAFAANIEAYLEETTQSLDQLSLADFFPDLAQLDALIESLKIAE